MFSSNMTCFALFCAPQMTATSGTNKNRLYFNATDVKYCQRLLRILCAFLGVGDGGIRNAYEVRHCCFTRVCLFTICSSVKIIFRHERRPLRTAFWIDSWRILQCCWAIRPKEVRSVGYVARMETMTRQEIVVVDPKRRNLFAKAWRRCNVLLKLILNI